MSNNSLNEELLQMFLNYLEFEKRSSKHTILSYKKDIFQYIQYLEEVQIHDVTAKKVRLWIVELSEQKLLPRTINRKISSIRSFYSFLQKINKVTSNPVSKVHALKTKKRLPVFVEKESMSILFDELEFSEDFSGIRDYTVLELLYNTGIRRAELISLQLSSFDLFQNTVKVLGKRNKERILPLLPEFVERLRIYIQQRALVAEGHNYFIVSDSGKKPYDNLIYRIVKKYLSQVTTVEKKSPHILRHSFATHLLNNGAHLHDIKELLGHANLSATQIYTHNSFEKLKEIYKQSHPRN